MNYTNIFKSCIKFISKICIIFLNDLGYRLFLKITKIK